MLKKTLLALLAFLLLAAVGLGVFVAVQPGEYRVSRSATVNAPPAVVFAEVHDFRNWEEWSPWEKLDPAMEKKFTVPESGVGASYEWNGNAEVGHGKMTITESDPAERVKIELEFFKPMPGVCDVEFAFEPLGAGEQTEVTWSMRGENGFVGKFFCLFMDLEAVLGAEFEKGLAELKRQAELGAGGEGREGAEGGEEEPSA